MVDEPARINTSSVSDAIRARPRRLVLVLIVGLLLAAGTGVYVWHRRVVPEPPTVDVTELEPAVVAALHEARQEVLRTPRSAEAWGRLGLLLHAYQFLDAPAFCFMQAERLDPSDPHWAAHHGIVLAHADPEAALSHWQRALERNGGRSAALRLRLANTLLELGRVDEGQAQLEAILRFDPASPPGLLGMGRAQAARGAWQEALLYLGRCAHDPTTRKAAHTLLAAAYQRLGAEAAAEKELHLLAGLPPDVPWSDPYADELAALRVDRLSRLQRADRLLEHGRAHEALALLEQLVREQPDFTSARRALGYVQMQAGNLAAAEQDLQAALKQAPDSAETLFYLGCVAMNRRQAVAAVDYLRRATAIKPDYAMAYFNLGECLRLRGDTPGALEAFRSAVRCRPYLAEAHQRLGELLAQAGRRGEAIEHLRSAVELDPEDRKSRELLERLQK